MGVAAGPMKRWRAPEHVAAGVLLLFGAIIVATAAVAWNNIAQLRQNDGSVTHSWQILNAIELFVGDIAPVLADALGDFLLAPGLADATNEQTDIDRPSGRVGNGGEAFLDLSDDFWR